MLQQPSRKLKEKPKFCPPLGNFSQAEGADFVPSILEELPSSKDRSTLAFATMVSNHKYLDGAMVLAESIRLHSGLVSNGTAEIILITNQKIDRRMFPLLLATHSRVMIVNTLAPLAAKSYYKTTFDKLYLFFLSQYEAIVFLDADSLAVGNPDRLFRKVSPKEPLVAVGGTDYFQTGLLIVKPSKALFFELFDELRFGSFGYNQWRGRDGILLRNCFLEHHGNIAHPTDSVFHFYGFVKPWFNKDATYKLSRGEKKSFGTEYHMWWKIYEQLHERYFAKLKWDGIYGGTAVTNKFQKYLSAAEIKAGVNHRDFMWMQHFSGGSEYLRPTFRKMVSLANRSLGASSTIVFNEGLDCNQSCRKEGRQCSQHELSFPVVNDCTFLFSGILGGRSCAACVPSYNDAAAPFVSRRNHCHFNFMHDTNFFPTCEAPVDQKFSRVCVCTA